jgi:phospholipid/cholesterol/gamma-HCH transport system ATP-binding protein
MESGRDELTGLASRISGLKRFRMEMARLQTDQISFSLILLTIRNMDEINTVLGRNAGQEAIRRFAGQLKAHMRITDSCSRFGLNKILLVLSNTDIKQARRFCNKVAREIRGLRIFDGDKAPDLCFTVNAGIVQAEHGSQIEQIIAKAETEQELFFNFQVCQ